MGLWCVRGAKQGRGKASGLSVGKTPQARLQRTSQERRKVWSSQDISGFHVYLFWYTLSCCIKFIFSPGWNEPDTPVDGTPIVSEPLEKVKKRYRKKKTKLEEAFPSYLQVNPTNISGMPFPLFLNLACFYKLNLNYYLFLEIENTQQRLSVKLVLNLKHYFYHKPLQGIKHVTSILHKSL